MKPRLVIGVGNPDRGDDRVGHAVVEKLEGFETVGVTDCSDLIDVWRDRDEVVVIDAMVSNSAPGTIQVFDAVQAPLPAQTFTSSHAFGLPTAVELSRAIGCLPRSLVVYGVEGLSFDHGCELSAPVRDALDIVVSRIRKRID